MGVREERRKWGGMERWAWTGVDWDTGGNGEKWGVEMRPSKLSWGDP